MFAYFKVIDLLCKSKYFQISMNSTEEHLKDLSEIRSLMERSSRFLSLSGLSGICAGVFALLGAYFAYDYLQIGDDLRVKSYLSRSDDFYYFFVADALAVLILSLSAGVYFSIKRARKKGLKIWDNTSKRLLINLMIPLATGGLFCILLLFHAPGLVASASLIFYGLALLNGSKYTHDEVRYLGLCEIGIGLICGIFAGSGLSLLFWAIGFGVLHIVYGILMYNRYEK